MGFPRQEHWRGLSFPSPGDLPNPGTEPASPALAGEFFTTEPPGKSRRYPFIYAILQEDCLKPWSYNLVNDILLYATPAYDIKSFQLMKTLVMFYFI